MISIMDGIIVPQSSPNKYIQYGIKHNLYVEYAHPVISGSNHQNSQYISKFGGNYAPHLPEEQPPKSFDFQLFIPSLPLFFKKLFGINARLLVVADEHVRIYSSKEIDHLVYTLCSDHAHLWENPDFPNGVVTSWYTGILFDIDESDAKGIRRTFPELHLKKDDTIIPQFLEGAIPTIHKSSIMIGGHRWKQGMRLMVSCTGNTHGYGLYEQKPYLGDRWFYSQGDQ